VDLLALFGVTANLPVLKILLPVGISFYTFQAISSSIDVYRNAIEPARSFINFALYISFFPKVVQGPIERAAGFLTQLENPRRVTLRGLVEGLNLVFLGLFKKVFVADNLAPIVGGVYSNPESTGAEYIIATWAFAFQIYGDFSGYTDMARGSSKCLGIELMENFNAPYFAIDPSDFWRRWHISLSTWLRDYLYIPLGGNKRGHWQTYRNLNITMLLGGLWHGAAWNFVLWGAYHGILLSLFRLVRNKRSLNPRLGGSIAGLFTRAIIMFQLTCIGWIFFRAESLEQIRTIFSRIFFHFEASPDAYDLLLRMLFYASLPLAAMGIARLAQFWKDLGNMRYFNAAQYVSLAKQPLMLKSVSCGVMFYLMLLYGTSSKAFIYFQF
jgi:alginate O-acetyltransferase complex protein AlgI